MKALKEPFVQFLLIGAVVFGASYLFTDSPKDGKIQVVISGQTVQTMRARLQKRFETRLSDEEIEAKFNEEMDQYIRQEILYREGLDRGLDREDAVVKNRVASKMERFAKEMASGEPFSGERIEAYYNENQPLYTKPKRISFGQILFASKERGAEQALSDCQEVLARIRAGELKEYAVVEKLGDQDPLARGAFRNVTLDRVLSIFGEDFAEALDRAGQAGLAGPVASEFGYHIVEIRKVTLAWVKPLDDVRSQIEGRLEYERNMEAFNEFYESIKGNYSVVVEDAR